MISDQPGPDAYHNAFDLAPCVVRDLSSLGAGLEFAAPEPAVSAHVVVQLQLRDHDRASIKLTGLVRHVWTERPGVVRAGIEFIAVGNLERALLHQAVHELEARAPHR